jgi:hypothetical protein
VRAPLAGKREAVRRLAVEVRRRLEPLERVVPVRLPGGPQDAAAPPAAIALDAQLTGGEPDLAARIDAARERLRANIPPPDDHGVDP